MTTKDVCDECDCEETLYNCSICKDNQELCNDCMIEHLIDEHASDILEEQTHDFMKKYMNEKI